MKKPESDAKHLTGRGTLKVNPKNRKYLIFNAELCTGCGECENACSLQNESEIAPDKSRIRVNHISNINFAIICQHCEDPAPCQKACPQGAIGRNEIFGAITISRKQCIGCGDCVQACPFGAIFMDDRNGKAYKCDLCRGDPECIKHCDFGALTFGEATSEIEADYKDLFERVNSFLQLQHT